MINLYRWSITFYHYLLNAIKLRNWKTKQTDLAIHCYKKKLPEKLSHVLSLLVPSILLGQSVKKLEWLLGKTEWGKWIELSGEKVGLHYFYGINKSSVKLVTCYLNIIWLNIWAFRKISLYWRKILWIMWVLKNTECVMMIL